MYLNSESIAIKAVSGKDYPLATTTCIHTYTRIVGEGRRDIWREERGGREREREGGGGMRREGERERAGGGGGERRESSVNTDSCDCYTL